MQKKLLSLFLFASVFGLALYFVSCQKDNNTSENQAVVTEQQSTGNDAVSDRGPLILGTLSTFCSCSQRQCNVIGPPTNGNQFNGIKVVLDPVTHNYYNSNGGFLTYTIRQGSSCNGPVVASFNCSNATVLYVSSLLQNNTVYSVSITKGSSSSPCYAVTTGNCRSIPCGIEQ